MRRPNAKRGLMAYGGLLALHLAASTSVAHDPRPWAPPTASEQRQEPERSVHTLDDLARLGPPALEALYRAAPAPLIPTGRVKGRPLVIEGRALGVPASRVGRIIWQGKVFHPEQGMAVNRFAGVRFIHGRLEHGPSWLDGGLSLILDYEETSWVYRNYRDEVREVAPGLLLGLMYDRRDPQAGPMMMFALDTR